MNVEKFSSLASLYGRTYPQAELGSAWRKVLFNQFHDILPGSGIVAVYLDADRDHAEVRRLGNELLTGALADLAARIRTEGPGVPVVVFNPLAWQRTDVVEVVVPLAAQQVGVRDPSGALAIGEVVAREPEARSLTVRFIAAGVPSLGYKVFHVVTAGRPLQASPALRATADTLENEFLRVGVDTATGCINSLFDKRRNRETLAAGACGNLLQAFRDKPRAWDAWNIDADFENEKSDMNTAEEVKLVEKGPVRAVICVVKKFQSSRFVQDITMYPKIPRLDVRMRADWHESHVLLKAAFPVAAESGFATFEIPFGSIQRPTTRRTPEEKAKFEVPALRWADLSDANGGLSLLNDSKYGYDAKGNVLRLSLLRSPKWPDPDADMGEHEFTYSLYPHADSWKEAGTVRRGYEPQYHLLPVVTRAQAAALPPSYSFLTLAPENLVLTALKKAEDGEAWILHFYESAGRETQARLRLSRTVVRAQETNLLEKPERDLGTQGNEVLLVVKPYEIKSVRVEFSGPGP